ncbi:MAG TPA: epoxyqueuosine reductase QueH [Atribacterota bacterium]|nr:epoxyqueuosine reductase QueH [Atribacterota bacterium]
MSKNNHLATLSYQQWLDREIEEIKKLNYVPELLLHSCCASCSSYVIDYLSPYFSITVFFYNPNIYPETEYEKRLKDQTKLLKEMTVINKVSLIAGPYETELFYQRVKGLEQEKEGGKRCLKCYELRLEKTAQKALELKIPYFTTTLTLSPHKNSEAINRLGSEIASEYRLKYLFSDFKKKGGFQRSVLLANQYRLYRQNYCGCIFSREKKGIHNQE